MVTQRKRVRNLGARLGLFSEEAITDLCLALSCPSSLKASPTENYKRLALLGDAIIRLYTCEYLYEKYPNAPSSSLNERISHLNCRPMLATLAREFLLEKYLAASANGQEQEEAIRNSDNHLAESFEAVVAVMYKHLGAEATRLFLRKRLCVAHDSRSLNKCPVSDAFSAIRTHFRQEPRFSYSICEDEPAEWRHLAQAYVGTELVGTGYGSSKKLAKQAAANDIIRRFG